MRKEKKTIRVERLIELQTFITPPDDDRDCVVLRVRTARGCEIWYDVPRRSFFELADCLARDAERMRPRQ